eukprot:UN03419
MTTKSLEQDVDDLEAQYHLLSQQLNDLNARRYMSIAEATGFTGGHLLEQIQLKIAELTKFHENLIKSQAILETMLELNDPDINEAYEDNKVVLVDQKMRLEKLRAEEALVMKQLSIPTSTSTSTTIKQQQQESQTTTTQTQIEKERNYIRK